MRFRPNRAVGRTLLVIALLPAAAVAFARADIGDTLDNPRLPAFGGTNALLLGEARANVFLFVKPAQEHSRDVLRQCAGLEKELAGQSVRWAAVVSDRVPAPEIEAAIRETGIRMPVLVDEGDALLGQLGVSLHPVAGIAAADRRLVAYQPYQRVNFAGALRARIRHGLGEIDDAALQEVLNPGPLERDENAVRALRQLNLAAKLHESGRQDKALACVQRSLELAPEVARAHLLHGQILQARGQAEAARQAFRKALELDPDSVAAAAALKALPPANPN